MQFHTAHLNFGQRKPKLLALQSVLLSSSKNGPGVSLNAPLEAIDATHRQKGKTGGPRKRLSEGGKWDLVE